MRKIVYTVMCLLCVFALTGCSALAVFGCASCSVSELKPIKACGMIPLEDDLIIKGDFKYYVGKDAETGEEYAQIVYVTNNDKKDFLIIPERLGGYRVKYLARDIMGWDGNIVEIEFGAVEYKKVYVPNTVDKMAKHIWRNAYTTINEYVINTDVIIAFRGINFFNVNSGGVDRVIKVYLPNVELLRHRQDYYGIIPLKANLQYSYNVDEISKRHWIDNVAVGSLLTPPPTEPTRQGYIFDGWYKETECISLWDFETDVTQTMEIEEGQEITEEMQSSENYMTMLYAKWIKK